jgi:type VII secretion-associated serine protease mycosin
MRAGRVLPATIAAGLIGALAAIGSPDRAHAAPACPVTAPAATTNATATDEPWPQQRYGLARLAGLADGAGVVVAVVDSGVDSGHPQLSGAVTTGVDALDAGGDGRVDCVGHGTAVASIVAARPRPGTAFRGVAQAATILPIRVSERVDGTGSGRTASLGAVAAAVRQATDRGASVINLSLTTERDDPALREAIRYARTRNALVVAAAGNRRDAGNPRPYPAAYDGVVGVGAIQPDGARVAQSQSGDYVDLVAPGADVTAAARGGGHARYTGTSFAAAYVAGTAALVRQYHPALAEAEVTRRLIATADAVGDQHAAEDFGAGMINPYRAVTASIDARVRPAPPPVAAGTTDPAAARATAAAARTRNRAYRLALAAAGAIAVLLLAGSVLRRRGTGQAGARTGTRG